MEDAVHRQGHLDEAAIPGTVHLVDLEGTIRAKHASGTQLKDVVLVPAPSADPDDPLNWSPRRSCYQLLPSACLTLADLNAGTGYMFLFFGWGCLFWQAIALQYGKRPVYLFSMLATLGIMIWVPHATSNGAWIGSKILQGFVGAPIESLCEISITDIYFTHERGTYMGLYAFMLAGSNFLAPVFAGFINDGQGWKWVMYWCAIFLAIGFVFCFFFMEETNYDRAPLEMVTTPDEIPDTATPNKGEISISADPEKSAAITAPSNDETTPGVIDYKPKTYMQKLSLLDKKRPFHLFRSMLRPLLFFSLPSVVYAGFSYGSNLVWFNVLNGTASLILSAPPYSFPPSMVGLSYFSPLIGVAVGSLYSGLLGDRIVLALARRNRGVLEPEFRLWLFSLSLLLIPGSLLLWGVGAAHHVHWFGLIVAMGVIAASNSIGIQLSVSYCIDCYKDLSGEAMVTVIIIRNTMSFAIGYGVTPWVKNMGYQNAFILAAFAGLAQVCTFLAVVKWGKSWRDMTKKRYYGFVKENGGLGLSH
ncbi:putative MFS-type transporter [Lachnellula subtilissima]|uniref:Putative MFS-type transporter n=1 Tax=Lachnellula subtilissima TaxID=602034 RepID=A0A8H8RHH1_9HELO|nr:putative MFS-type transporter [Lachnellula subtilissima]